MADTITPAAMPPSYFAQAPVAAMNAGLNLLSRRSTALAEFWRSFAEVRQPTDLMAVQLNFWTQLVDDYQEALSAGMAQLSAEAAEAPVAARSA